jgi:hypothetical protein
MGMGWGRGAVVLRRGEDQQSQQMMTLCPLPRITHNILLPRSDMWILRGEYIEHQCRQNGEMVVGGGRMGPPATPALGFDCLLMLRENKEGGGPRGIDDGWLGGADLDRVDEEEI